MCCGSVLKILYNPFQYELSRHRTIPAASCLIHRSYPEVSRLKDEVELLDMPNAAQGMMLMSTLNTPVRQTASQIRARIDLHRELNMALTATQGVMAVGLLSVLFGADLLTLLGSKVRHKSDAFPVRLHCDQGEGYSLWALTTQDSTNAPQTQGPVPID